MKTSADHPALTDRRRGLIFLCLVVSGIASSTLSTAMTTALPNLVTDFGVSTAVGQWVTSGYSLAMGVIPAVLTAFLITRLPTRRLYLTGIAAFIAGLLLSIFAGNFNRDDGGAGAAGVRQRPAHVGGAGDHPHRLSPRKGAAP